ncbi:MAG: EscU/YscU/HrcU family type III secretion system export apparatus switch protein [Vulcanimicrobiaceae bacterium]
MSSDQEGGGEKQFEATQSRIERAQREGNVAKSQEVSMVAAFGAALPATAAVIAPIGSEARAALIAAAGGRGDLSAVVAILALALVPIACGASAGAAASLFQAGGLRVVAVVPKFERLNPFEGVKRMLSRETAISAARATVAFTCAAAAIAPAIARLYAAAPGGGRLAAMASAAWSGASRAAYVACAVGAAFAAVDFGVQFARWRKRLRMSFDELKRDAKEHDGDPVARGRRRAMHRQIARGSLRRVKDAAFVVTNPTHLAIALEYRPPEVPVPRVLVRAAEEAAARVRELAAAYRVPVVENVPLARALYAGARPGETIPAASYVAVAEVVAALLRTGALGA